MGEGNTGKPSDLLWATGTGLWARLEFSSWGILFPLSGLGSAGRKLRRSPTTHTHSFSLNGEPEARWRGRAPSSLVCRSIKSQHRPSQREEKRAGHRKANGGRGRERGEKQGCLWMLLCFPHSPHCAPLSLTRPGLEEGVWAPPHTVANVRSLTQAKQPRRSSAESRGCRPLF